MPEVILVAYYITPSSRWDFHKLNAYLIHEDVEENVRIPISVSSRVDNWI